MLDKQGAATGTSSRKQAPAGSSRGGGGRRARGSGGRWESRRPRGITSGRGDGRQGIGLRLRWHSILPGPPPPQPPPAQ